MTRVVVGIDPSIKAPGAAVLIDGVLVRAERVPVSPATLAISESGARVDAVAEDIAAWVLGILHGRKLGTFGGPADPTLLIAVDELVYEWPQIYGVGKSQGDPNDLIALAAIGAAVARELRVPRGKIHSPKPVQWQAGTKKNRSGPAWKCTRGAKLRARLTPAELEVVEATHDAIDAACLALHPTPRALAKPRRAPNTRGSRPRAAP